MASVTLPYTHKENKRAKLKLIYSFLFIKFINRQLGFGLGLIEVVIFYCRANTNTIIANSANIERHDLARRKGAKDQNKNVG